MWSILLPTVFLTLFSLVNLFGIKQSLVINQTIYYLIGVGVFVAFRKIGLRFFRDNAKFFYWLFVILLIVTFIIGIEVKGSKRWIDLYFLNFQSSEFLKVFFVIFMADFFAKHRQTLQEVSVFLESLVYFIIPTFIIFKQPDLGNAAVFMFVYLVLLVFSKVPKRIILYASLILIIILPLGWFTLKDYQKGRITSFFSVDQDQSGAGYNAVQSQIAVGSGKFLGRGLGFGTQSKLLFLPENHTDFAFSALVEQFGFFGGFWIIFSYLILSIVVIGKIGKLNQYHDEDGFFNFLFTLGIFSYFIIQVFVNIGMNLGVLPITGIALPFVSYGGSSLVGFMMGLALLP